MKLYDVTLPLSESLPAWPGDRPFRLSPDARISAGDACDVSSLTLSAHTGTHVDAPRHFIPGALGVDALPLEILVGDAWVCRIPEGADSVSARHLEGAGIPDGISRLLLATSNGRLWDARPLGFSEEFLAISPDGARWLVDRGIVLVGVDYLSVDPADSPDSPAHRTLLGAGIIILEGLDLRNTAEGPYILWCLPLKIVDGDGAPARVILARHEG